MKGAHPNHHRIILLCNGGNIDYPKRYCKNSESPTQFPTKRGRFNSFISSQWVSSYCFTNHPPEKLCRKPPRSPGRRQPQQPDSVHFGFGESTGMGPGQGKGYHIYIYMCVCTNVSIYIYTYISTDIYILYIYTCLHFFNIIIVYVYITWYNILHSYTLSTQKILLRIASGFLCLASALQFPWFTAPMFHGCTSDTPRYWHSPSKPNLTIVPQKKKVKRVFKKKTKLFFMKPLKPTRLQHSHFLWLGLLRPLVVSGEKST